MIGTRIIIIILRTSFYAPKIKNTKSFFYILTWYDFYYVGYEYNLTVLN